MAAGPQFEVWYLPWAGLREEVRIGPVTFWPFNRLVDSKVSDVDLRRCLARLFARHFEPDGRPVDTIAVCTHDRAPDLGGLDEVSRQAVREASDALTFCIIGSGFTEAVSDNADHLAPPSADRYQLVRQCLKDTDQDIVAVTEGCRIEVWELDKHMTVRPSALGGSNDRLNLRILEGFDRAFAAGLPADTRARLWRSLEWFRFANIEAANVSALSKLVMMATAYEVLLDVPSDGYKSLFIAEALESKCSDSAAITKAAVVHRKGGPCDEEHSLVFWWAMEFYQIRNKIVHGDKVELAELIFEGKDRRLSQLQVADVVFWEYVTRELLEARCLGDDIRMSAASLHKELKPHFPKDEPEELERSMLNSELGFDSLHKALDWRRPART